MQYRDSDRPRYLEEFYKYFERKKKNIHAVGFKLLWDAYDPYQSDNILEYVINNKNIYKIFVWRENLLNQFLSYEIAQVTGEWLAEKISPPTARIRFDEVKFLEYKQRLSKQKETMDRYIANISGESGEYSYITYEDIRAITAIDDLFKTLTIMSGPKIAPGLRKQNPESPLERVENPSDVVATMKKLGLEHWLFGG
jgi:integrase